jgi:hypothetical protein
MSRVPSITSQTLGVTSPETRRIPNSRSLRAKSPGPFVVLKSFTLTIILLGMWSQNRQPPYRAPNRRCYAPWFPQQSTNAMHHTLCILLFGYIYNQNPVQM